MVSFKQVPDTNPVLSGVEQPLRVCSSRFARASQSKLLAQFLCVPPTFWFDSQLRW